MTQPEALREALRLARPYVEDSAQRGYDGTNGHAMRAEAKRRLDLIDAALEAHGAPEPPRGLIARLIAQHEHGIAAKDERAWRIDAIALLQGWLNAGATPQAAIGAAPEPLTDEQIIAKVGRDAIAWLPISEDEEVVGFVRWILDTFGHQAQAVAWQKPGTNLVVHADLKGDTNNGHEYSLPLVYAGAIRSENSVHQAQAVASSPEPPAQLTERDQFVWRLGYSAGSDSGAVQRPADECAACHGARGGVRGNENIVGGRVLCDYCTQQALAKPVVGERQQFLDRLRSVAAQFDPPMLCIDDVMTEYDASHQTERAGEKPEAAGESLQRHIAAAKALLPPGTCVGAVGTRCLLKD